jgi:hypothetical protein
MLPPWLRPLPHNAGRSAAWGLLVGGPARQGQGAFHPTRGWGGGVGEGGCSVPAPASLLPHMTQPQGACGLPAPGLTPIGRRGRAVCVRVRMGGACCLLSPHMGWLSQGRRLKRAGRQLGLVVQALGTVLTCSWRSTSSSSSSSCGSTPAALQTRGGARLMRHLFVGECACWARLGSPPPRSDHDAGGGFGRWLQQLRGGWSEHVGCGSQSGPAGAAHPAPPCAAPPLMLGACGDCRCGPSGKKLS